MLRLGLRPRTRGRTLVRLGTDYGGWWVPEEIVGPGTIAYCGGAGEDISFDLALFRRGCTVRVFDPTPRAIAHVQAKAPQSDRFAFVPVGWWSHDEEVKFYAPIDARHVSHSVVNLQGTQDHFIGRVRPVHALMAELGDARVDLIKMDIEGAEREVLPVLLRNGPLPKVLCVEFDQPCPVRAIAQMTRQLKRHGLVPLKIEGWNVTYERFPGGPTA
jgi:FkbM family methyltransferase